MKNKLEFELPYPPSVNHYWGVHGHRRFIKKRGLIFRDEVHEICSKLPPLVGGMSIDIKVYPPDNRRRDLDNILKATLDAMEKAGLYKDDKDFNYISLTRQEKVEGGKLEVTIWEDFS